MSGCPAYFDFVSPDGSGRDGLNGQRVDRLDCYFVNAGHSGKHEAEAPEHVGPATVTWE